MPETVHTPVLLHEVIDILTIHDGMTVLDCTAGGGGHAERICSLIGSGGRYIGLDADTRAVDIVRARLGNDPRVTVLHENFRNAHTALAAVGVDHVDRILIDLGLSSDHLARADGTGRGFSFLVDEPLLMTFDSEQREDTTTAYDVVNSWSEASLADVIFGFGGERSARRIARAIVESREHEPIRTSAQLAQCVADAIGRRGARHPATKTFQAIRMAVNDELGALADMLRNTEELLAPGGRIAVISFHSLEDGLVKRTFRAWRDRGLGDILTGKPIVPSHEESVTNARARSAKLRAFEYATRVYAS